MHPMYEAINKMVEREMIAKANADENAVRDYLVSKVTRDIEFSRSDIHDPATVALIAVRALEEAIR